MANAEQRSFPYLQGVFAFLVAAGWAHFGTVVTYSSLPKSSHCGRRSGSLLPPVARCDARPASKPQHRRWILRCGWRPVADISSKLHASIFGGTPDERTPRSCVRRQSPGTNVDTRRCSTDVVVVMVDDSGSPREDSDTAGADRDSDLRVPGLTVQRRALDFAMQSQLMGILDIDPSTNCLVVRTENTLVDLEIDPSTNRMVVHTGNTLVDVAWPLGWSVAIRNGEIALIDAVGQTVRRLGDEVWAEGGSIDADQANVVSCTGRKQVFVASGRFSGP